MNKQHILNEIKRTAIANNGVPLGIRTFAKETGIKDADWLGKYWARWSDAVKEAGLTPNPRQTAFERDAIIEKVIAVAREHGHFPFKTELQMKSFSEREFPSHHTIYNHLGHSKVERAAKVREYCAARAGYHDVVALCDAVMAGDTPVREGIVEREGELGFVYLMKSGRHYKIGRSVSVGARERQLTIQLPDRASTIHSIATDDPVGIEAYWHKRFESKRKNGEWFELTAADVTAFKRRKFM